MMEHMGLDNPVKDMSTNKAELAIYGCGGATSEAPGTGVIMGQGRISVLQIRNSHCTRSVSASFLYF